MKYSPRRTREQWQAILNDFQSSGLTAKNFCQRQKISYASFIKWKQTLNFRSVPTQKQNSALIKVIRSPNVSRFDSSIKTVTYHLSGDRSLMWDATVDPSYIASVLRLLP
jgi:hypothetical protein